MKSRPTQMHLPEIRLAEALQHSGCALCWLLHRNIQQRLQFLFEEFVNDPDWRLRLRQSQGFCPRHAAQVLQHAHILSLALICEDLIASLLASPRSLPQSQSTPFCTLCEAESLDAANVARLLAGLLIDKTWRQRYEASEGLCLPHLRGVLRCATRPVRRWLWQAEQQKLSNLQVQLKAVIRKHDYRFQAEPWGEEVGSWRRALRKLCGELPAESEKP